MSKEFETMHLSVQQMNTVEEERKRENIFETKILRKFNLKINLAIHRFSQNIFSLIDLVILLPFSYIQSYLPEFQIQFLSL